MLPETKVPLLTGRTLKSVTKDGTRLPNIPIGVGFHLCGAYLRNQARNRGLRAPTEAPDQEAVADLTAANRDMIQRCRRLAAGQAKN